MPWTTESSAVSVHLDEKEHVRLISHLQYPFEHASDNPYVAAVAYLRAVRPLLELTSSAISHLESTIPGKTNSEPKYAVEKAGRTAIDKKIQLRWSRAFVIRDEATVLMIQQTRTVRSVGKTTEGVDVEFAGLRIVVHRPAGKPLRITGIASALTHSGGQFDEIEAPGPGKRKRISRQDVERICTGFGLPAPDRLPATIEPLRFLHRIRPQHARPIRSQDSAAPKQYCIANSIRVVPGGRAKFPAFELVFRESDFKPLLAKPLGTHAHPPAGSTGAGVVFEMDPVSASGDFAVRPNAAPGILDRASTPVSLAHLIKPGADGIWKLSGTNVYVYDGGDEVPQGSGWIGIEPPTKKRNPDFTFGSRTNDFAAVNAYYHLDRMFALLESLGMPFSSFPMGYTLPVPIIHRAALHPGPCNDGNCINAQVRLLLQNGDSKNQTVFFAFALADLARNPGSPKYPVEPLGIACDVRVIWHEFCHALIAASTNFLEFPFAHSAGDALAAINGDPDSRLAAGDPENKYRGVTFPWGTTPGRRHDRRTSDGWSWSSALGQRDGYENDIRDMFGYAREQILASTLFRLYRAIGGDATTSDDKPDIAARKAAALYSTYLIVRAICSLGPQRTVPAWNAESFAVALAEADIGTSMATPPLDRIGGTVHKVIRWAFEKQGLFQTDDPPGPGQPAPVDIFLEDGRKGEYEYKADWQASTDVIWNNTTSDPNDGDQTPVPGTNNYIFVRVKNRGHRPAKNVTVCVFSALKGQDTLWPNETKWTPLSPPGGTLTSKDQSTAHENLIFGPFAWRPVAHKSYSFLARIEADGDYSNINPATMLPCALNATPLAQLVPLDNNIGLRTIGVP